MSTPPFEKFVDGIIAEAAGLLPAREQEEFTHGFVC